MVLVNRPATKKGRHRQWAARLLSIDLKQCVSFINDYDDSNGLTHLIEKENNNWFDIDDCTAPLWRVLVVNHRHVIFTFQHGIADGVSGVLFHKHLRTALNERLTRGDNNDDVILTTLSPPTAQLYTDPQEVFLRSGKYSLSRVSVALEFLLLIIIRTFIPFRYLLFGDLSVPPVPPVSPIPPISSRCVTNLESFRLDNSTTAKCVELCRVHDVTFTTLLYNLILTTLATDIYPEAAISLSGTALDLRRYLDPASPFIEEDGNAQEIRNFATTTYFRPWLRAFRAAKKPQPSSELEGERHPLDIQRFWASAKSYHSYLTATVASGTPGHTPPAVMSSLSSTLIGEDVEDFAESLKAVAIFSKCCWMLSNLGVVDGANTGDSAPGWSIDGIEFAASAFGNAWGYILYCGAVSLKGGDCVVNVTFQEGVITREKVNKLLEGVQARLRVLLHNEGHK